MSIHKPNVDVMFELALTISDETNAFLIFATQ